eukprot:GFUD01030089.1.p1 GENE.GFUD01030089.1~~GFUD01030089.1.p1  ORF type:complete len:329 (-),score=65.96 GFUD01030089.1:158-1144(-)
MLPTPTQIGLKASLEILSLTILSVPMFYIHIIAGSSYTPFHRGFFCDDQNLKHPYTDHQTVPMMVCLSIWTALLTVFIVFIELLRSQTCQTIKTLNFPIFGMNVPWIVIELYRHFGFLTFGGISSIVFTDLSKFTIGRLRPHFLTVCQPDYDSIGCKDDNDYQQFITMNETVESEICQGLQANTTIKMLREARMSFMSGHASFSFYCATFLVIYLQARLNKFPRSSSNFVNTSVKLLKVVRPFIQFGTAILAFWIALTRVSDYFHHPLDVLTGSVVGIAFGLVTLSVANIFNNQTAFWKYTAKMETIKKDEEKKDKKQTRMSFDDFVR